MEYVRASPGTIKDPSVPTGRNWKQIHSTPARAWRRGLSALTWNSNLINSRRRRPTRTVMPWIGSFNTRRSHVKWQAWRWPQRCNVRIEPAKLSPCELHTVPQPPVWKEVLLCQCVWAQVHAPWSHVKFRSWQIIRYTCSLVATIGIPTRIIPIIDS